LFTTDGTDITDIQCWESLTTYFMLSEGAYTARSALAEPYLIYPCCLWNPWFYWMIWT